MIPKVECPACGALLNLSVERGAKSPEPTYIPPTHQAAARTLFDTSAVNDPRRKERAVRADRTGVHPDFLKFAIALEKECLSRGWPMFWNEFVRDKKRQDDLKAQGVSKASFGQSAHNFGMAGDLVHFGRYWALNEREWALVGVIGKDVARRQNLKITWGGDWSFYDPAHWELANWRDLAKVPNRA